MISPNLAAALTVGGFAFVALLVLLLVEVINQERVIRSMRRLVEEQDEALDEADRTLTLLFGEVDELERELEWMRNMTFGSRRGSRGAADHRDEDRMSE